MEHFGLKKFIQFNTFVEKVLLISSLNPQEKTLYKISASNQEKFVIKLKQLVNNNMVEESFELADYVFVCNGRFSVPFMPLI